MIPWLAYKVLTMRPDNNMFTQKRNREGMAGIVHVARPHFGDDSPYLWPLAFAVSTAATLVNAVRYVQRKNAAAKEPAKKAD